MSDAFTTTITLKAIPQDRMRYETAGDWRFDSEGNVIIEVAGADVWHQDEAFLIALHELVECRLAFKRGITQGVVDRFDMAFKGEGEPGDAVESPYQKEHRFACLMEFLMAHELGVAGYGKIE